MPQEVFGPGSIRQLADLLTGIEYKSLFLVTGKRSFEQATLLQALEPVLADVRFIRFCDFEKNPRLTDLETGIAAFKTLGKPAILALGGGSVIDMAKLIQFFATLPVNPMEYLVEEKRPSITNRSRMFLVAVPTTAGTGSEATQFATVYIDRTKYSLDEPSILPDAVILDPELTMHLPPKETAESGLDALTHAIESYWNVKATEQSKAYAREAVRLSHQNIEAAVLRPNLKSRTAMQKGANLAGKAINITRTTAAHAISYPMTAHFGVPHGQAVSLSLPYFFEFNYDVSENDVLDPRGPAYVKKTLDEIVALLGYHSIQEAKEGLIQLMQRIGAKTSLKDLGIDRSGWDIIVENGFNPQRVRNNPRALTEPHLRTLLSQFGG